MCCESLRLKCNDVLMHRVIALDVLCIGRIYDKYFFYHIGWLNMMSISLALKSLVSLCITMVKVMVKVKHLG